MSDRLVVLGSCGAWPEPGKACSGFVLEYRGFRVVLDLGYGTLPRLLALLGSSAADGIDAVVVTHEHPDHAIDVHGLFRARFFGRRGAPPLPLYAPKSVLDLVSTIEGDDAANVSHVFDWHPLPSRPYQIGPLELQSYALPHYVPNAGVRLSGPGLTVAYTGDCGPDPSLVELGRNADLFIMEASDRLQQPGVPPPPAGKQRHLNSHDAGLAAQEASARRLLLTHFWPGNDRERSRAAAEGTFTGEVLLAEEGLVVQVP
jgi:ribonuclease BN (tRNA processing enzyme)